MIAVDDGSTDSSGDVIKGYQDRVRTPIKANGGQASALNAGFAVSTGGIVIFLDCDDYLYLRPARSWVKLGLPTGRAEVEWTAGLLAP